MRLISEFLTRIEIGYKDLDLVNYSFSKAKEVFHKEYILNWLNQLPHWDFLTNWGISELKGLPYKRWKKFRCIA